MEFPHGIPIVILKEASPSKEIAFCLVVKDSSTSFSVEYDGMDSFLPNQSIKAS